MGSSTIVGLLASYGFRYNAFPRRRGSKSSFCRFMAKCASGKNATHELIQLKKQPLGGKKKRDLESDIAATKVPFAISLTHEVCNAPAAVLSQSLECGFGRKLQQVKQLFIVREPLSRAISVYYFWGELYKLNQAKRLRAPGMRFKASTQAPKGAPATPPSLVGVVQRGLGGEVPRLGSSDRLLPPQFDGTAVQGALFRYHGDEQTAPPEDIALSFARNLPFRAGMGSGAPSFTWSFFANSLKDTLDILRRVHDNADTGSNAVMALVADRLDESLVVAKHFLNGEWTEARDGTSVRSDDDSWSLADLVYVARRKSLSQHPKAERWPPSAVRVVNATLQSRGEFEVYGAAQQMLDKRIALLEKRGIDFGKELGVFSSLRQRVTDLCFSKEYLERYREHLKSQGLQVHPSNNKLREVDSTLVDAGHEFSLNREVLYSFDVCGNCEAHGIMAAIAHGIGASGPSSERTVEGAAVLKQLPKQITEGNVHFKKCPL